MGVAVAAFFLLGAKTPPEPPVYRPEWSELPLTEWPANQSYLANPDPVGLDAPMALLDGLIDPTDVFDPGQINELRYQYMQMSRQRELLKDSHVGGRDADAEYLSAVKDFSGRARAAARTRQRNKGLERARRLTHNGRDIPQSAKVVAGIALLSTGQPVDAHVAEDVSLRAAAHLPLQVSYLQLSSPWLNTDFSVSGGSSLQGPIVGIFQGVPDWVPRNERYHVGFSRQIPVWSLSSGVAYGGTSRTVGASLSKALTPHLSASVGSTYGLDADTPTPLDQHVEMHYEIHF